MVRKNLAFSFLYGVELLCLLLLVMLLSVEKVTPAHAATQIDISGPPGSGLFGYPYVLPNGNILVIDTDYDLGSIVDVGAVHLYNGATGALISTLTGSTANDQIGKNGITILSNGNYVVNSGYWHNGAAAYAGAVTWCDGITGCDGVVSTANSLVGVQYNDSVGSGGVIALPTGHYVVRSPVWNNETEEQAGAVSWCNGTTGCTGVVSSANSLVGVGQQTFVGSGGVTVLPDSNYVVSTPSWHNGSNFGAGAATWCNGFAGCTGTISVTNSLVGGSLHDQVSKDGVTVLSNGHYVVGSSLWDNGAATDSGAATWCDGATGCTGLISAANSLVGASAYDHVGVAVTALSNNHYVVQSPDWDLQSPVTADVGAATWCNGASGCTGEVTTTNSLIGSTAGDRVGLVETFVKGVEALSNGHYVVRSPNWDLPSPQTDNVGAITWCNGTTGCVGTVSTANSLVGGTYNDRIGSSSVLPLTNGHYVVRSPNWDLPSPIISDVGAVTWCNGAGGCIGTVSASNSLTGGTAYDVVGGSATALSNGNYVVRSNYWDLPSPPTVDVGAVTWCDGTSGCMGAVSVANSLVGSTVDDRVGGHLIALSNGHYVVGSSDWDLPSPLTANVGAATWCDGTAGCPEVVSATNSLVGSTAGDQVGSGAIFGPSGITPLSNGNYVVYSPNWDNNTLADAGAVTFGAGNIGTTIGTVTEANSVRGAFAEGVKWGFAYDPVNEQLVVGRPSENLVILFRPKFTSIADGDWSSGSSWDYGVFTKPVDVVIAGHTLTINSNVIVNSLTLDPGSQLTLPLNNTLSVETGVVNKGTLVQTRPVNGSGSVAFLELWDSGGSTIKYRGAEINTTNNLGNVTVSVRELNAGEVCPGASIGAPAHAARCYNIAPTNNLPATIRLYARTADELNGIAEADLSVFRYSLGWTELTTNRTTGNVAGYSYAEGSTSIFSNFLLGQSGPVPALQWLFMPVLLRP